MTITSVPEHVRIPVSPSQMFKALFPSEKRKVVTESYSILYNHTSLIYTQTLFHSVLIQNILYFACVCIVYDSEQTRPKSLEFYCNLLTNKIALHMHHQKEFTVSGWQGWSNLRKFSACNCSFFFTLVIIPKSTFGIHLHTVFSVKVVWFS